jgi:hypothetical protein
LKTKLTTIQVPKENPATYSKKNRDRFIDSQPGGRVEVDEKIDLSRNSKLVDAV